jgi:hypothetical protein
MARIKPINILVNSIVSLNSSFIGYSFSISFLTSSQKLMSYVICSVKNLPSNDSLYGLELIISSTAINTHCIVLNLLLSSTYSS